MGKISKKILFVSAHPDDETLGCGGTIHKHKACSDSIFWLIITNVDTDHGWKKEVVQKRQKEILKIANAYGFEKIYKLDYPTAYLDTIPIGELIKSISLVINDVKPEVVYIPNRMDVHTDHLITYTAMMSCVKNFRTPSIKRFLTYETLSETEFAPSLTEYAFLPNVFNDITVYYKDKIKAMKIYKSEVMEQHLPRSLGAIEALGRLRGSRIGVKYAEAFRLLNEII